MMSFWNTGKLSNQELKCLLIIFEKSRQELQVKSIAEAEMNSFLVGWHGRYYLEKGMMDVSCGYWLIWGLWILYLENNWWVWGIQCDSVEHTRECTITQRCLRRYWGELSLSNNTGNGGKEDESKGNNNALFFSSYFRQRMITSVTMRFLSGRNTMVIELVMYTTAINL